MQWLLLCFTYADLSQLNAVALLVCTGFEKSIRWFQAICSHRGAVVYMYADLPYSTAVLLSACMQSCLTGQQRFHLMYADLPRVKPCACLSHRSSGEYFREPSMPCILEGVPIPSAPISMQDLLSRIQERTSQAHIGMMLACAVASMLETLLRSHPHSS